MAVQSIQDLSLHEGIVLTDCKQLADAFSSISNHRRIWIGDYMLHLFKFGYSLEQIPSFSCMLC
jgi:hypothetical protein